MAMRQKALQSYVENVLMYGYEAWTKTKLILKKKGSIGDVVLEKSVTDTVDRKKDIEVMEEAGQTRSLVKRTRR